MSSDDVIFTSNTTFQDITGNMFGKTSENNPGVTANFIIVDYQSYFNQFKSYKWPLKSMEVLIK